MIRVVKIKKKNLYGEYIIKSYRNGKETSNARYFTDDKNDLEYTCEAILNQIIIYEDLTIIDIDDTDYSTTYYLGKKVN